MASKKCLCCLQHYNYCPSCSKQDALKPAYFATFCSEDCKNIWDSLTKFNFGTITKAEAKSIISTIDLKPIATYAQCVQRDLAVVMAEEPKLDNEPIPLDVTPEFIFEEVFKPLVEQHEVVITEENK